MNCRYDVFPCHDCQKALKKQESRNINNNYKNCNKSQKNLHQNEAPVTKYEPMNVNAETGTYDLLPIHE